VPALQSLQIPVPISTQFFQLRIEIGIVLAAMKERHFVAPAHRGIDKRPTEKDGATQDQQLHGISSGSEGSESILVVVRNAGGDEETAPTTGAGRVGPREPFNGF